MTEVGAELLPGDEVSRAIRLGARLVKVRTMAQAAEAARAGLKVITRAESEVEGDPEAIRQTARAYAAVVPRELWVAHIAHNEPNQPRTRQAVPYEDYAVRFLTLAIIAAQEPDIPWATPPLTPYDEEDRYWQLIAQQLSDFKVVCSHHYWNDRGQMLDRLGWAQNYRNQAGSKPHIIDECNSQGLSGLEDLLDFIRQAPADGAVVFAMTGHPEWRAYDPGDEAWRRIFSLAGAEDAPPPHAAEGPAEPSAPASYFQTWVRAGGDGTLLGFLEHIRRLGGPATVETALQEGWRPGPGLLLGVGSSAGAMGRVWTEADMAALKALGIEVVVVGLYEGSRGHYGYNQFAYRTLKAALGSGLRAAGYIVDDGKVRPGLVVRTCKSMLAEVWARLAFVAVDVEVKTTVDRVRRFVEAVRAEGQRPWIYTGRWFWEPAMGNTSAFADLPLWDAAYGVEPSLEPTELYGGWVRRAGHQFSGTTNLAGLAVDVNVFDGALLEAEMQIPDEVRKELRVQLDAAWGEAEGLRRLAHGDVADRIQAALAVVATRLRELGVID